MPTSPTRRRRPFFAAVITTGASPTALGYNTDDFLIGGHIGYNWQSGMFVFGLETDIDYAEMNGGASRHDRSGSAVSPRPRRTDYDYFGTFRGRVGAAFDRFLVYGTGGLAYAGSQQQRQRHVVPALGIDLRRQPAMTSRSVTRPVAASSSPSRTT